MPRQLVLLHRNANLLKKLPNGLPDPLLHLERMKVCVNGEEADVLVAYGRYKLWGTSADRRIRWAEIDWPDDGMGICGHGAGKTLLEAVVGCFKHKTMREQLRAQT